MNIKSCDGCGLVYDLDKIKFPSPYNDEDLDQDGGLDSNKFTWCNESGSFKPFIECLICETPIISDKGEY